MDSARALPTIGTSASASDLATDYGSEPGLSPGGVRTDGDDGTITTTIMSASITLISITIGTMALLSMSMVTMRMPGMAESGRLIGARILILIPVVAAKPRLARAEPRS